MAPDPILQLISRVYRNNVRSLKNGTVYAINWQVKRISTTVRRDVPALLSLEITSLISHHDARRCRWVFPALGLWLALSPTLASAEPVVLLIQPILTEEQTRKAFAPLCAFIAKRTGGACEISTAPNFMAYWDRIRRNTGYQFVLDAAHFTDWRAQKHGFHILAKMPDSVSYTLIASKDAQFIDPEELIGKSIATLGPPSIGAARLASMFPNPVRQPHIVEVSSSEAALELMAKGRVHAAILPTPFVSQQMARGAPVTVITTTEPIPHIALSASANVDAKTRAGLQQALADAENTPEGRAMLKAIGFERFERASPDIYAGHSRILKEYWGY